MKNSLLGIKLNKLDLHGVKHQDVDLLVENFVLMNQDRFPLTVICGNSVDMIRLVEKVLNRIECKRNMYRYGIIIIEKLI